MQKVQEGTEGAAEALAFINDRSQDVAKVLGIMDLDGSLAGGRSLPASCYNDYYKFTMTPAILALERARGPDIRCTFSVNIRHSEYRKQLYASALGTNGTSPALFQDVAQRIQDLAQRKFDRDVFERCVADYRLPGWDSNTLDAVCGTAEEPRTLAQEVQVHPACTGPIAPSTPGNVLMQLFLARDEKLHEDRVFIEATGPWHKVTWLETSMMQAVYEALFRDRKRRYFGEDDSCWYPQWLAEAFCRCVRSVAVARETGLKGALFTGRRTGGLALMQLQALYVHHAFRDSDGNPLLLGTSSVTSVYTALAQGVDPTRVPRCAGTHAHELSMVSGALLGDVDDEVGMPISQIIGHLAYFYKSLPQGDVREGARKALMPMLPDTLGTKAFMKAAQMLTVPFGPHAGHPLISIIGAARQDSGCIAAFKKLMEEFGFSGALMASEIETAEDLITARDNGYRLFGAGGFMGDSEKAWDASACNISMAVKVLRVHVNGEQCTFTPVKTGDRSPDAGIKDGKFEADGLLPLAQFELVRDRSARLAAAEPAVDAAVAQEKLRQIVGEIVG